MTKTVSLCQFDLYMHARVDFGGDRGTQGETGGGMGRQVGRHGVTMRDKVKTCETALYGEYADSSYFVIS